MSTTVQPDATCFNQADGFSFGNGCIGSELGYMFYMNLGGVSFSDIVNTHIANY